MSFKFIDETKPANVALENDESILSQVNDQFFTPCGPFDTPTNMLDCTDNVDSRNKAQQFSDATIDSTEAPDTMIPVIVLTGMTLKSYK